MQVVEGHGPRGKARVFILDSGQLFQVEEAAKKLSNSCMSLELEDLVVLHDSTCVVVGATEGASMGDSILRFTDEQIKLHPCLKRFATSVIYGRSLTLTGFGEVRKISVPKNMPRTLISYHTHHIVFHSLTDLNRPVLVIKVQAEILGTRFGWDVEDSYSSTGVPIGKRLLQRILSEYFEVLVLCRGTSGTQLHRLPMLLPAVQNIRVPEAVAEGLCFLYDTWLGDRDGSLRAVFKNTQDIQRRTITTLSISGSCTVYNNLAPIRISRGETVKSSGFYDLDSKVESIEDVFATHELCYDWSASKCGTDADVTLREISRVSRDEVKSEPKPLACMDHFKTLASDAKRKVSSLYHSGRLNAALQMKGEAINIDDQLLMFAETLRRITTDIVAPLEKYSVALTQNTSSSFGVELPGHTCAMRGLFAMLLEDILSSLSDIRLKDQRLKDRLRAIKERNVSLRDQYRTLQIHLSRALERESSCALARVMSDFIIQSADPYCVLPNLSGLRRMLGRSSLLSYASATLTPEECARLLYEDPNDPYLNTWKEVLRDAESIDRARGDHV